MQIYIISISHTLTPFHVNNIIINCSCKNQVFRYCRLTNVKLIITRMWANAQRDGRPAKYRWFPLFNAAKFGWRPLLECRAVTLRRRESVEIWKRAPNSPTSQPLVGWSSPYCEDMCGRHECLWPPYVIEQAIIFLPCGYFFFLIFFPRLISAVADWMSAILPHMVWS